MKRLGIVEEIGKYWYFVVEEKKYDRFQDGRHIEWSEEVKRRNGFRCQVCQRKGQKLHSHHKNCYSYFWTERFDLENGITLCEDCHERFHAIYGKNLTTEEQFREFLKLSRSVEKSLREEMNLPYD